ncbi:hypothetical protein [Breoghania sp.]|uniref:hypothetical protein n=1 Tax=Breoghania sp. TaxID=2065378 RepID=UPI002AAB5960|nr:hypothetical protein [Breoghania sp.]
MIIDPQAFGRRRMTALVTEIGSNGIVGCDNLADALSALVAQRFDLVIIDRRLGLPAIGCLIRALRQSSEPRFRNMTAMLSTDRIDRDHARNAGALGFDGIVVTPCTARILNDRIDAAGAIWNRRFPVASRARRIYGTLDDHQTQPPARLLHLPAR